jgi:uncharacterized metal-binding protein YceD (DUF177 family)
MKISLNLTLESLEDGPFSLAGDLPGTLLDLESESNIRNVGPISYELKAELSGNGVLVMGIVGADMELECVRSGVFFSTRVEDSAFLRDYSMEDLGDSLDLSEDVREAVVIQIPNFPVSPEAQAPDFELPKLSLDQSGDAESGESSPWNDLDQLNL